MKNEKIDMSRETDTFRVSQEGMYIITGTNSRHGITVSAGVRATIVLKHGCCIPYCGRLSYHGDS